MCTGVGGLATSRTWLRDWQPSTLSRRFPHPHRPNSHNQSTSWILNLSALFHFSPIPSHKQLSLSSHLIPQILFYPKIHHNLPNPANMKFTLTTPALLLSSAYHAQAWGTLGHETVAFIAQNFVAADTKVFFSSILNDQTTEYLAKVATWADSFRYTKAGKFSEPFHFIDAEDNPPDSCGVKYSRDCGATGCVVGAIQNYVSFGLGKR